ncbi:M17 family metallopeptidase [Sediminibacter sp. Hel_I_10]|uniref:leucyl aminopeptidase family protein n=1 Tax=Sediminibacter sp. Hel_I_10 TaxID=1392490 RepID=UPI00068FC131|nr:leucyl aminopeptidase family protein [Sediminibacter sp. Hel_I_10]
MTYQQAKNLTTSTDYILPCRASEIDQIKSYIPIEKPDFDGAFGSYQLLYGADGNRIYLLGLGGDKHTPKIEEAFRKLAFETQKFWGKNIQVYAESLTHHDIKKAVIGLEMATYHIAAFKSEIKQQEAPTITFVSSFKDIATILKEGQYTGATINRIKSLVDAPPNVKTPEYLGDWAKSSAENSNYKCTVIKGEALKNQGFEAVISVGKGSVHPPVVIVSEYYGAKKDAVDIALVGKGITFDSGGLSIKPSTNLHYMKSDMGGAAVVLGVIELIAKLKLKINVVGVVASAENAVDGNSYRPGDVINSYSGKTIEIIDTDAEGRLVLADALSFVNQKFKPTYLIDLATLTGGVVRALGYSAAGMFTKNQEMAEEMSSLGNTVHERVWQLPLYEDFESDLHSDIADIRNFSGKSIAGAINAAKFLEVFTDAHYRWMHLDIAGVSFGDSPYAKMKSASGYGIQLITAFITSKVSK